jgi:hypothetical protein
MKAKLELKITGIRGNSPSFEEKGRVVAFVEKPSGKQDRFIAIDAFEGSGNTYKRREESLVTIQDEYGRMWEGSFNDLIYILLDHEN